MEPSQRAILRAGHLRHRGLGQWESDVRRWDVALGARYAGFVERPLARSLGRMLAVLLLTVLLLSKFQAIARLLAIGFHQPSQFTHWLMLLNYGLQIPFLALALFLVTFRGRQVGGVARFSGILAAIGGTCIPSLLFFDSSAGIHALFVPFSIVLLAAGMTWAIWSLTTLGRCFGVVPEARGLVTRGPYRFVRHPVYLGEITATFGLLLPIVSAFHVIVFAVFVALQLWRMTEEEAVLATSFTEYRAYQRRTWRLIPGVW